MRRTGLIALAILALAAGARAETPPSVVDAASRFAEAGKALEARSDGFGTDGAPELLSAYWDASHAWATAWLGAHSDAKPKDLAAAGEAFDGYGRWQALALDSKDVLVAAASGEQGEVFILHQQARDRWSLAWSLTSWAAHRTAPDPLAAWAPARSSGDCRSSEPWDAWKSCGPLFGSLGPLPPDGKGRPRFFIDADYAQEMGATVGAQASIWVWTGTEAVPQYLHAYAQMIDQGAGVRAKGHALLIREKDGFKTMFACGGCLGRQMDRTVRLTPDGVSDLGHVSQVPDLDLVDAVMDRVLSGKPAGLAASPQAAAALKAALAEPRAKRLEGPEAATDLGMIIGWTLKDSGARRRLCLSTDSGGTFIFTLVGYGRATRIARVSQSDRDCGKGAKS